MTPDKMKRFKHEPKTVVRIEILGGKKNTKVLSVEEDDVEKVHSFLISVFEKITVPIRVPVLSGGRGHKITKGIRIRLYTHKGKEKGKQIQFTLYAMTTQQIFNEIARNLD